MAAPAKKGGSAPAKKKVYQVHPMYKVEGETLVRNNKACPKCGPGVFLANHKGRCACGACGYTELQAKAE